MEISSSNITRLFSSPQPLLNQSRSISFITIPDLEYRQLHLLNNIFSNNRNTNLFITLTILRQISTLTQILPTMTRTQPLLMPASYWLLLLSSAANQTIPLLCLKHAFKAKTAVTTFPMSILLVSLSSQYVELLMDLYRQYAETIICMFINCLQL